MKVGYKHSKGETENMSEKFIQLIPIYINNMRRPDSRFWSDEADLKIRHYRIAKTAGRCLTVSVCRKS